VDKERAAAWLDHYVDAWKTYDRDLIADLFTPNVEYRYHPYDDPVQGREAVVDSWLGDADEPNTYEARYEPVAVDGDVVVATGTSSYLDAEGQIERIYHNCFVMRFDTAGRCSDFVEWFVERPS
jgi:ketosteroid isomerase-like protein